MAQYRGVETSAVVESLREAGAFLDTHRIGPHTDKLIDPLCNPETLTALGEIKRGPSFAKALGEANLGSLKMLERLFLFHARADTDGVGARIYENLSAWGAFAGARSMKQQIKAQAYFPSDREIDSFIAVQYLKILDQAAGEGADTGKNPETKGDLPAIFNERAVEITTRIEQMVKKAVGFLRRGNEDKAREWIARLEPEEMYPLTEFLEEKLGVEEADTHIDDSHEIKRYVVPYGVDHIDRQISPEDRVLKERVKGILRRYKADATGTVGFGATKPEVEPRVSGVIFDATPRMARIVSEQMNVEIRDEWGQAIEPPQLTGPSGGKQKRFAAILPAPAC